MSRRLRNVTIEASAIEDCELTGVKLKRVSFKSSLDNVRLAAANLVNAILSGAKIDSSQISSSSLSNCPLSNSQITNCVLGSGNTASSLSMLGGEVNNATIRNCTFEMTNAFDSNVSILQAPSRPLFKRFFYGTSTPSSVASFATAFPRNAIILSNGTNYFYFNNGNLPIPVACLQARQIGDVMFFQMYIRFDAYEANIVDATNIRIYLRHFTNLPLPTSANILLGDDDGLNANFNEYVVWSNILGHYRAGSTFGDGTSVSSDGSYGTTNLMNGNISSYPFSSVHPDFTNANIAFRSSAIMYNLVTFTLQGWYLIQ